MNGGSPLSRAGFPWMVWLLVLPPALGMGHDPCYCVDWYLHFTANASPEYRRDVERRRLAEKSSGVSRAALLHIWEHVGASDKKKGVGGLAVNPILHDAHTKTCAVRCPWNLHTTCIGKFCLSSGFRECMHNMSFHACFCVGQVDHSLHNHVSSRAPMG